MPQPSPTARITLRAALRRWWSARDGSTSPRRLGALAKELWEYGRAMLPGERRKRWGDADFDFEHHTDTSHATVDARTELLGRLSGTRYYPTEPYVFEEMVQALPAEREAFTFIDLGSGKGRALLLASQHGFRKIVGVELLPELHAAAERNAARWPAAGAEFQLVCGDAAAYAFPPEPLVVYLFNPFPPAVLEAVLRNLRASWERRPRAVFVAYRFPEHVALLEREAWLRKVAGTEQWAIYAAQPPTSA